MDLGRKKVVARPETGLPTRGVALSLDGLRAYVVSSNGSRRAPQRDRPADARGIVAQIGVPAGARGVALSADGTRAYVTSGGSAGRLTIVNLRTGFVAGEITTPRRPAAVALSPDGARAYVLERLPQAGGGRPADPAHDQVAARRSRSPSTSRSIRAAASCS